MFPQPDDPALKRQYQLEHSFAVKTERRREFRMQHLSPMPENLALKPVGCSV